MSRRYRQLCPLAQTLDRVGERWTLLIIRDLAFGPKRYSDLLKGLPGIGTTLLVERLRRLEDDGLVNRRELPPPAASTVYELTEDGRELMQALLPLASFGIRYLDGSRGMALVGFEWVLLFLQNNLDQAGADGVDDVYEFRLAGSTYHLHISGGQVTGAGGRGPRPADVLVRTDWRTFFELGFGHVTPADAVASGRMEVTGEPEAVERAARLLTPWTRLAEELGRTA